MSQQQQLFPGYEPSVAVGSGPSPTVRPEELLCVVDALSLIFQVFHAIPEMTSPRGEPVNAVFGFVRDLLALIDGQNPDYLVVAFDPPGDTFRHELFPAYKGHRGEMPPELLTQLPKCREVVAALGLATPELPGYEADDVLATLAHAAESRHMRCLLVTGDKDCRQLISPRTQIYNIRKSELFGASELRREWGIAPEQVVDFQALVGDAVDNVPGVPLIGPKIAAELLAEYGDLETVLANAANIKGPKRRDNLLAGADQARLSRALVRLETQVPIEFDWNAARIGKFDQPRLVKLMADFGFRSLGERVAGLGPVAAPPTSSDWDANYRLVDSLESLEVLVSKLSTAAWLSIDTETTSTAPRHAELVGISLAAEPGRAFYVPVAGPAGDVVLPKEEVLARLRPLLESSTIAKVGQNLKYDLVVFRAAGIDMRGIGFDTMVASYLLESGERSHGLDQLAQKYLGHTNIAISELIGRGKNQKRMDEVPVALVAAYAAEDADVPLRLMPLLESRLQANDLLTLNRDIEVPLIEVLAELEYNGVRIDSARLAELSAGFAKRLGELEGEIEELAGHPFNVASPKQLADVLFKELGLPVQRKTKTGASTDAEVLEHLAGLHPLPAKIIEHRQYAKLKGTYVDALPQLVHPGTGRVHASFNQVVAATGRLSSSDPNLQNIPVRTPEGRDIRSAFVARCPGWKLLAADYSQIELRVLAHFSRDQTLCDAFAQGIDIHTLVASQVNHVPLDEVTSAQRRGAKAVNFGIIYGQSPFGLAKALGISKDEAARFIADYFARYPGVADFMSSTLETCRRLGYVSTLFGRRRAISGIRPPGPAKDRLFGEPPLPLQLTLPERTAVNTVIQGTAADLIKLSMIAVHRQLQSRRMQTKMILQIHDELLFDGPASELSELVPMVRDAMQQVAELAVPLVVDVKVGDNWAECEPVG